MKKKGFTLVEMMAAMMVIAVIAVLAVPPILTSIRNSKKEISDAMEQVIVSASDLYMSENSNQYTRYNGNRYCITLRNLVESDKLDSPIYDPTTSQEISSDKFVKVEIFDNEYSYEVVDNCEEIRRNSLAYVLRQQYQEGNTTGLLKDESGYYYKGTKAEVASNFVWFGGHLWRVISIDNDDNLTMITQQPLAAIQPASQIWDTQEKYESSYINQWLNEVFLANMDQKDQAKIQNNVFNVGMYDNISEIKTTQKVGLLDESQYIKAGAVNSYLDIKEDFWLGNRYNGTYIRGVYGTGELGLNGFTGTYGVRPVIKISSLVFTDGNGTLDNPYREQRKATNMADIKVGEYISVPTSGTDCGFDRKCLFRVVSKDNDSIKVILNGILPSASSYGTSTTYTSKNAIDTRLTTFANTIDPKYRYIKNKTFYIGEFGSNASYIAVQNTPYSGNVGLPVIGELFSGNDIDITQGEKTFVNASTIENPTTHLSFWTMNAFSASYIRYININGNLDGYTYYSSPSDTHGVRPVLFLNNNLSVSSGEGTAEKPFTLS